MDDTLLSRVEDAGLNASAPLRQRWLDGWIVRYAPGKARRARCINAVAEGRLSLEARLAAASAVYAAAGLPMVFRITPYTRPAGLDEDLDRLGFARMDETCVLVRPSLDGLAARAALPAGIQSGPLDADTAVRVLADFRQSSPEQAAGHLERMRTSPIPYRAWALRRAEDGLVLACGQWAQENETVGLYDVHTHPDHRNRGLAQALCGHMLARAAEQGARVGYLQVEAANQPARRAYDRLGFQPGYTYHYRQRA